MHVCTQGVNIFQCEYGFNFHIARLPSSCGSAIVQRDVAIFGSNIGTDAAIGANGIRSVVRVCKHQLICGHEYCIHE